MKIRKFAAALLALVLCLSLSLPAAFAEAQQRVELKNLTVNVKCTGNAIPDEQLTIRLTPRKNAPMPGDAAALEALPEEWKSIDVLINNAGLVIGVDKEFEGSLDEWDIMIDTNIRGLLAMTRLVVPGMVERGCGHIINIGSIAGDAAYPGGSVYCATKAAVKALSDGLRIDVVDTPLRVTNIKPGMVETNFTVVRYRGDKQAADNFYKGIRPLTGDDIAETVYYAASAPAHIQIAEVLLMPTYQATGTISYKKKAE